MKSQSLVFATLACGLVCICLAGCACRSGMNVNKGAQPLTGSVYFVAMDGDDTQAGGATSPFKTIAMALSMVKPGDTVRIRAGNYCETMDVHVSGMEGKPITLEGERGSDGGWLTKIDPSVTLTAKWVPAPEVGAGVYKMPFPGFEPFLMLVDGKFIPRIWPTQMDSGEGFKRLAYPSDHRVKTYVGNRVAYWDVMGAMYGCKDGQVYVRFRDGDDPNDKHIRIAPEGGCVKITGQSRVILRDLCVQGGEFCISIKGPAADHNIIERCRLVNASRRINVEGASFSVIRNNHITAEFYSDKCLTGAWGGTQNGEAVPYELGLKYLFYHQYKTFFGPTSTSDFGVTLTGGSDNEIYGNHVSKGGQGIHFSRTAHARVYDNVVQAMSSIGIIVTMEQVVNAQIHDNLILDCNIGCRIHHVNAPKQLAPRSLYVYRNRFWQPPGVGSSIFFHYYPENDREPYLHPDLFIYHNSFCGGKDGMKTSSHAHKVGGIPNALVINNVFANPTPVNCSTNFGKMEQAWIFDYNWLGGTGGMAATWRGSHNVAANGESIWAVLNESCFVLPTNSTARQAGLDVSQPFEAGGRSFPALPGMEPGYFNGAQPDVGAVQH